MDESCLFKISRNWWDFCLLSNLAWPSSNNLNKNRNIKIKGNLPKEQRKALKEIRQINNKIKVYPFNEGSGFVILSEGDAIKKLEEQLEKLKF